jgi:Zn-dependent protease with chaperone function
MDEHHKMRDTLIEFAVVGASANALSALIAAAVAFLMGEFVSTRAYLFALGLVSALLAYALSMLLSRQGVPREKLANDN